MHMAERSTHDRHELKTLEQVILLVLIFEDIGFIERGPSINSGPAGTIGSA